MDLDGPLTCDASGRECIAPSRVISLYLPDVAPQIDDLGGANNGWGLNGLDIIQTGATDPGAAPLLAAWLEAARAGFNGLPGAD